MIKIGLDTESLHLWFQNHRMDIFGFIETAHEFGLDGVMINIISDYGLDPEWGTLESNKPEHLARVKALLDKYNMYCEIATKGIGYDHLVKVLDVAEAIGADIIRTYIPITLNPSEDRKTGGEGKYDLGKIRRTSTRPYLTMRLSPSAESYRNFRNAASKSVLKTTSMRLPRNW